MVKNRLQNKVAGSELTFPVCIITAVAMWWWPQQAVSAREFVGLLLCLLTAFVLMETNTRQHIIRIHKADVFACAFLQGAVAGGGYAAVCLAYRADAGILRGQAL